MKKKVGTCVERQWVMEGKEEEKEREQNGKGREDEEVELEVDKEIEEGVKG